MRLVLLIFRATVFFGLFVVVFGVLMSVRLNRGTLREEGESGASSPRVTGGEVGGLGGEDWRHREADSKRRLVSLVPSLGVPGNVLREEFDRRARLFRQYNPEFFNEPEWPERLWELMARDLSLQDLGVEYPWKRDGMRVARP